MSFFGDILTPLKDAGEAAFDAVTGSSPSSASTSAPVPTVPGGPPKARAVSSWSAPDASGSGQISVHRDVLRSVAKSMQSDLKDMDTAVAAARTAGGDAGSIRGWSTGTAFSGNASNACHAIAQVGAHVGNAQQTASKNVADCASTYDAAESDNQQAISGVGTQSNAAGSWGPVAGANAAPAAPASSSSAVPSIDVKTHGVAESDVAGMTATEVMDILHSLPSGEVAAAGAAHTRLGSTLEQIATRVTQHAHTLAQNWTGSAAQAAMVQFQALHGQTATLAQQATQTGAVLSWLGNEVLPKFKALPDPTPASPMATDAQAGAAAGEQAAGPGGAVVGAVGGTIVGAVSSLFGGGNAQAQAQANQTAQQYLKALNAHLVQANQALPSPVGGVSSFPGGGGPGAGSPSGGPRSGAGAAVPGSGYAGGSGSGPGAGTGSAPGTSGMVSVPRVPPVSGPGGSGTGPSTAGHGGVPGGGSLPSPTGRLQSVPVPPGGSPPPSLGPTGTPTPGPAGLGTGSPTPGLSGLPVPGPAAGGTASGLGADEFPANAVSGGGISGGVVSGEEVAGVPEASGLTVPPDAVAQSAVAQSAVADTAVGTSATPDGMLAAGAEGQADYGMTGLPMMGSGAADQEKERRRKAWLGEDADIWGLPSDHVPPVIEGGG
jgi:hypothetical protein